MSSSPQTGGSAKPETEGARTSKGDDQVTTATVKPAKQDKTTLVLLFIAALVAVGGIGFAVGHLTAPTTTAQNPTTNGGNGRNGGFPRGSRAPGQSFDPNQFPGNGGNGGTGRTGAGGFGSVGITGTVDAVNGNTLTIKLANGSTVTVNLTGSTTYHNETTGSSTDVQSGKTVIVQIDAGGFGGGPNAGTGAAGAPGSSAAPAASGAGRTITAKDILITTP